MWLKYCSLPISSYKAHLTDLRISEAKRLLLDPKKFSVETIAHSCGFADALYFSTCFKKHVGCSPLEYRKQ